MHIGDFILNNEHYDWRVICMDCYIRKAHQGDELSLAYIQTESWKAAFRDILPDEILQKAADRNRAAAMYRQLLDENVGNGYILEVDAQPHCVAWWDKTRDADMPDYAELICIHSLQDNWGKGYGTHMMRRMMDDMRAAGYEKVMLWVFTNNLRARKFYESCGFITRGKVKPYLETEEICYEREL